MNDGVKPFRPLLAATIETEEDYLHIQYPLLASPKIDGIRIVCHPTLGPITRSGKKIPNTHIRSILEKPEFRFLDGEITVGTITAPDVFNRTQSAVMSISGTPLFEYTCFDSLDQMGTHCPFAVRLDDARSIVDRVQRARDDGYYRCNFLEHQRIENREQLDTYEEACVAGGYEGVMLRRPDGKYKQNRSTLREGILLKLKRFLDAEAVVIGWEPLERNENKAYIDERGYQRRSSEKAGKVVDETRIGKFHARVINGRFKGVEFSVGSGLDDAQRLRYCQVFNDLMGKPFTFKFQLHGSKDAPRAPIFKSFHEGF